MTAVYSGDSTYQGSIGPPLDRQRLVDHIERRLSSTTSADRHRHLQAHCPNFSLTSRWHYHSLASPRAAPSRRVTITATPANGFTGTVVFSATAVSTSGYIPTLTFSPVSVTISSTATATTTLTLSGITASLRLPNLPGQPTREPCWRSRAPGRRPFPTALDRRGLGRHPRLPAAARASAQAAPGRPAPGGLVGRADRRGHRMRRKQPGPAPPPPRPSPPPTPTPGPTP